MQNMGYFTAHSIVGQFLFFVVACVVVYYTGAWVYLAWGFAVLGVILAVLYYFIKKSENRKNGQS